MDMTDTNRRVSHTDFDTLLQSAINYVTLWSLIVRFPPGLVILSNMITRLKSCRDVDELLASWPYIGEA